MYNGKSIEVGDKCLMDSSIFSNVLIYNMNGIFIGSFPKKYFIDIKEHRMERIKNILNEKI